MKKSPFSTPRGNGGRQQGLWNSGGSPARGYPPPKSYEFCSPNRNQSSFNQSGSDDFIPFDNTPPPSQRKSYDNWQSPRGQWQNSRGPRRQSASPGYTNYRDNRGRNNHQHQHHQHQHQHQQQQQAFFKDSARQSTSPGFNNYGDNRRGRDNHHHQQQPFFKNGGRQFHGAQKNFQRGNTRRKADISQYMNLRSFLEDPWSELLPKSCEASTDESKNESSLDLSFSNAVLGETRIDDIADKGNPERGRKRKSVEADDDSLLESDTSFSQTSQEYLSACSDISQDRKLSRESIDSP